MKKSILFIFNTLVCFSSVVAQFNLQGDGYYLGSSCYLLTEAENVQISTIWHEEQINLNLPFELQFKMNFGNNDQGADGMMFVLQNESSTIEGQIGEDIGFGNIDPGLGIEFDTFKNENLGDMNADHIGIHRDGQSNHNAPTSLAGPVQAALFSSNIEDGEDHAIRITWDPVSQEIRVYFNCLFRLSANIDLIGDIFDGESLVWWGFTASTGGLNNVHSVCLYDNVSPSGNIGICPGDSTQLIAGGNIYGEYNWTPIDFLDDPTVYNPIASPPTTMIYTVSYTSFCGFSESTTIEVTVEPVEVEIISNNPAITCENSEVNLIAYTNYPDALMEWTVVEGDELSNITNYTAEATGTGIYMVTATSIDGNCSSEDTFEVIVDTLTYLANAGQTFQLNCYESSNELQGSSDGEDASFVWSTTNGQFFGSSFIANPTVLSEGTYNLTVTNPNNDCTSTSSVEITEDFTYPEISLGNAHEEISCENISVQIQGTEISPPGYTNIISWESITGSLEDSTLLEPSTTSEGEFALTVTFEENGCSTSTVSSTSSNTATVSQDQYAFIDIESMVIPNIFSPNGDAYNSHFRPVFTEPSLQDINPLDILDIWQFKVRDRWGNLAFDNYGAKVEWDGLNLNGIKLSSGTYYLDVKYRYDCIEVIEGEYFGPLKIVTD